ncbi:MAG: Trk system potassium transporter TrkA [Pontiellaceae bacterium]
MRILIVGAGNAGRKLASRLCEEKHNVVMVDNNPNSLAEAEKGLDILSICGEGTHPKVLQEAEVEKADLFVALTDSDQVNILSCLIANAAGVKGKVARVIDPGFLEETDQFDLHRMGIDLIINQKQECANEVLHMLMMPGAHEVFDLFNGQVMVAGYQINAVSPLLDRTPAECNVLDLMQEIRAIAIRRGDKLVVPRGNTKFEQNDLVYIVGTRQQVFNFFTWISPDIKPFKRLVIAGGGDLGLMVAQAAEKEIDCVLLESDKERAAYCSGKLNKTLVLHTDSLTEDAMKESGINDQSALIALTGDDENNIMNCLLAQKMGAAFTATQIARIDFIPVVEQLYLVNRIVSPYISTTNTILHWLRSKKVRAAALLHNLPGELLDMVVAPGHKNDGLYIKDISLPKRSVIATVLRENEVLTANGDLKLSSGDRVLVFTHAEEVNEIRTIFQ